jgi:hypothetical protein
MTVLNKWDNKEICLVYLIFVEKDKIQFLTVYSIASISVYLRIINLVFLCDPYEY